MWHLQTLDSNHLRGKSHFENDGTQNYLLFKQVSRNFKTVANTIKITVWQSKRLSDEKVKPPSTSDNSLNPGINYFDNSAIPVRFNENCLK